MKKKLVAMIAAGAMIASMIPAISAYAGETETPVAPDYSKAECWYQIPEITKDVDTFFIYPTVYNGMNENDPEYALLDNEEMKQGVEMMKNSQASVFEESTNVFIPYYRQASTLYVGEVVKETGSADKAVSGIPYQDVTSALDYYFKNYNDGRPFIIASHSQGSAINRLILKNYFKEHPEYYERMIAAYSIGYSITKEDLEECPHLEFATGESDTGVIISWNTEGPKNVEENAFNFVVLPNSICINPLNWKRDETYAPASENKGSLVMNEKTGELEIGDVGADAQVNLERGVVVTNPKSAPADAAEFLGPESFHPEDYGFYYNTWQRELLHIRRSNKGRYTQNKGVIIGELNGSPVYFIFLPVWSSCPHLCRPRHNLCLLSPVDYWRDIR